MTSADLSTTQVCVQKKRFFFVSEINVFVFLYSAVLGPSREYYLECFCFPSIIRNREASIIWCTRRKIKSNRRKKMKQNKKKRMENVNFAHFHCWLNLNFFPMISIKNIRLFHYFMCDFLLFLFFSLPFCVQLLILCVSFSEAFIMKAEHIEKQKIHEQSFRFQMRCLKK